MIFSERFKSIADKLDVACGVIDRLVQYSLIFFIGSIFFLLMLQVVMRYLIRSPLVWVEELTSFTLAYLVMWACSTLMRKWKHIRVDTFVNAMPSKVQLCIFVFINILIIYIAYLFIFAGYRLALLGEFDVSPSGFFNLYWPKMALVTGGVLIIIQAFNNIVLAASGGAEYMLRSK
jgi:TRAP-type C4-dicarboxylate transport system permease small subunit